MGMNLGIIPQFPEILKCTVVSPASPETSLNIVFTISSYILGG